MTLHFPIFFFFSIRCKIIFLTLSNFILFIGSNSKAKMPEPFVLDASPLTAEAKKIAEIELNETPERVAEATVELRRLLHENTDLYFRDDDDFLKIFLRPTHYYPESALKLVSGICSVINQNTSYTSKIRQENVKSNE